MKYLITYYTQLDDDYIDKRQMILKNKYNAMKMYDKIASEQKTVNVEMEELRWLSTNYTTIKPSKMYT